MVAEPKIFTDSIVCIVDLLTAAAGFQVDLDADFVNGHSLQAQTYDLGVARVLPIEVSQKLISSSSSVGGGLSLSRT